MSALPWMVLATACGGADQSNKQTDDSTPHAPDDIDGDGYSDDDCDDANASVFPGAAEKCDGLDNDCDEVVDDEAVDAPTWHRDDDADGYGSDTETLVDCEPPTGFVATSGDCDDTLASVHPSAKELCNDGLDNDCVVGGDDACRLRGTLADDATWDIKSPYGLWGIADTSALARAGDVIGDDAPDLLVGLPHYDEAKGTGAAVLCASPLNEVASLDTCVFIAGQRQYGAAGQSVTGAGDLDEDGVDDFLVGEPGGGTESHAYFFYGPVTEDTSVDDADVAFSSEWGGMAASSTKGPPIDGTLTVAVSDPDCVYLLDPNQGNGLVEAPGYPGLVATLVGAPHSDAGEVVHDMGDVSGDGASDLGIGSNPVDSHSDAPSAVYLVADPSEGLTSLSDAEARFDHAERFGAAHDENGDGYEDVLVASDSPTVLRLFLGPVDGAYDVSETGDDEASIEFAAPLGVASSLDPTGVDFDGDFLSDIAYVSFVDSEESGLSLQYAPVAGALDASDVDLIVATHSEFSGGGALENVGDTDNDGHEDLITISSGDLHLLLGAGI